MKTLIIYASKTGATRVCAEKIQKGLSEKCDLLPVGEAEEAELTEYDKIILGTYVHAGNLDKGIKDFITTHQGELMAKPTFLYLSCMATGEKDTYIKQNFSDEQRQLFKETACCGGAIYFSKMNFFERILLKMIVNKRGKDLGTGKRTDGKTDLEMFDEKAINNLINKVGRA